jgi:hypothetical protein
MQIPAPSATTQSTSLMTKSGGEGSSSSDHGSSRHRRQGQRTTSTDMGSDDSLLERVRWNDNGATRLVVGVVHGRA